MTHKEAPPETPSQIACREFWQKAQPHVTRAWGRAKSGAFLAEESRLLHEAWECAATLSQHAEWPSDAVAELVAACKERDEAHSAWDRLEGSRRQYPGPEYQRARKADVRYVTALQSVRPPAKPEFDRALETSRRVSAVEKLIADGFVWSDGQWQAKPDAGVVTEEDVEIALTITQGPPEPPGSNSLTREFNRPKIRKALESYASRHARQVPGELLSALRAAVDNPCDDAYWILQAKTALAKWEKVPPAPEKD